MRRSKMQKIQMRLSKPPRRGVQTSPLYVLQTLSWLAKIALFDFGRSLHLLQSNPCLEGLRCPNF